MYLSEYVWRFLLTAFKAISDEDLTKKMRDLGYSVDENDSRETVLEIIAHDPSAFLGYADLLNQPELMRNMILGIIPDENSGVELEYIFTREAVEDMKAGKEFIVLDRVGGPRKNIAVTKEGLAKNLARHCEIDYVEDRNV